MLGGGATHRQVQAFTGLSRFDISRIGGGISRYHKIGPCQEFNGKKYYRTEKGYWRCKDLKLGKTYLHIDTWKAANGRIPDGHHVHHIDLDKNNNALSNLELKEAAEHQRHHQRLRHGHG